MPPLNYPQRPVLSCCENRFWRYTLGLGRVETISTSEGSRSGLNSCTIRLMNDTDVLDVLVTNPQTGLSTGLDKTVRRAIKAMEASGVPYCVIGAAALAARGLPRMTRDLDLAILRDAANAGIAALRT